MTQDAFAEVAGVSKRAVANYEGGSRKPDSDFLTAQAQTFSTSWPAIAIRIWTTRAPRHPNTSPRRPTKNGCWTPTGSAVRKVKKSSWLPPKPPRWPHAARCPRPRAARPA